MSVWRHVNIGTIDSGQNICPAYIIRWDSSFVISLSLNGDCLPPRRSLPPSVIQWYRLLWSNSRVVFIAFPFQWSPWGRVEGTDKRKKWYFLLQLVHISKIIRNFAVEKVMMSENKRNLTEKEEYYKLITDEKSNHIGTNANGAGSQCVRRKNIGSLSFRERYLSLRQNILKSLVNLVFARDFAFLLLWH